ncbi:MAG: hypothetical protein Q9207_008124 [Kuettlingeria erythrocarpa]
MSCHLVGEDFTDGWFSPSPPSALASDASSVSSGDDSSSSSGETDEDSVHDDVVLHMDMDAADITADELMEEAEEIFWRRAPPRLRLAATPSIVARIFHFAMQARGNEVVMPGNTRNVVAAGLRLQVMAINHNVYHQCRDTLYRDNDFVVGHYGSGLRYLSSPMGIDMCRHACVTRPAFSSLRLVVGSQDHDVQGVLMSDMYTQALRDIQGQMTVAHLCLELAPFCFLGNKELAYFAELLAEKIQVTATFEFRGSDIHWLLYDLRIVPQAMGMKLEPKAIEFKHHDDEQQTLGWFSSSYIHAQSENEKLGLDAVGNELETHDGQHYSETHQNIIQGIPSYA